MEAGQRKPETQWIPKERKATKLDQRLKSLNMSVLPDDQMNSVINCLTAKSTWDDLILYHEGPSDVKESRVMDLNLCYNTFKFKEGESLTQTFTRYKALMNELDFQDSPGDEEDTRSSQEYINDLEEEYKSRALLAESKRHTKDFEAKYNKVKAKLALLSSSALAPNSSLGKNKGLIANTYDWDEEEVSSDDNEVTEVKALMALADEDRVSVSKESAINGIKINEPSSAPARGNKSSSASKTNSAPAGKSKNVKMEDDPPLAIVMKELNELKLKISKNKSSYFRNKNSQQVYPNALQNKYKTQFKMNCELAIYRTEVYTEVCTGVIYPNKVVSDPGYDKQWQKTKKLHEPLAEAKPTGMKAKDWALLDRQALGAIRLSLAKNVAYNVVNEKTAYDLFKALSNMYEKPSASNKVFLIRQLVNTKMKKGASVIDHVNEFNSILSRLMSVDIKFDDEVQALLLLSSLPESWSGTVTIVSGSTGSTKLKFDNIYDLILRKDTRRNTSGEYSNSLLSAKDKGRGRKQDRGQKQNKSRSKSKKRGQSKNMQDITSGDYDDTLVCCVENTIDDRIMDSGASFHATYCKEELERFKLCFGKVCLADDKTVDIAGVGDVVLKTSFGTSWTLKDVRYILGLKKRLISVGQLDEEGYHIGFGDQQWKVKDVASDKLDSKSVKCIFIGYGSDEMGYHFVGIQKKSPSESFEDSERSDEEDSKDKASSEEGGSKTPHKSTNTFSTWSTLRMKTHLYDTTRGFSLSWERRKPRVQVEEKSIRIKASTRTMGVTLTMLRQLYVEDQRGFDMAKIKKLKRQLSQEFEMKDRCSKKHVLGYVLTVSKQKSSGSLDTQKRSYHYVTIDVYTLGGCSIRAIRQEFDKVEGSRLMTVRHLMLKAEIEAKLVGFMKRVTRVLIFVEAIMEQSEEPCSDGCHRTRESVKAVAMCKREGYTSSLMILSLPDTSVLKVSSTPAFVVCSVMFRIVWNGTERFVKTDIGPPDVANDDSGATPFRSRFNDSSGRPDHAVSIVEGQLSSDSENMLLILSSYIPYRGRRVGSEGRRVREPRRRNVEPTGEPNGQGNDQSVKVNEGMDGVPDFSTIIAQQLQNLLPTILAQVGNQDSNQGDNRNQNRNVVNEDIQGNVRNVSVNNNQGGCSYKEFLVCNPKEYDGNRSTIVLMRLELCLSNEMQKLETKLWNRAMVKAGHDAYTDRFHKLASHRNGSIKKNPEKRGNDGEPTSGQLVEIDKVIRGCKLEIEGHVFDINLIPFGSGSFDVIIGMDWLSDHKAKIICHEKVVRITLLGGKVLRVLGERMEEEVRHLLSAKAKEKKQEEIVVVRDFPKVFPNDLSGLPPIREIKFRTELTPGAMPVLKFPYRLTPSELEELSGQLKEL
ncbi:retrovirus-related pol polyprotein from transposon TNT 1-94 [Tanacetum coccineum]